MLQLTNTMTGKKEVFKPREHDKVLLYVCGITPYDFAHVGHGRVYVSFDVLYRLLKMLGYSVNYCRNFTDIDDKLIAKAQKEFGNGLEYSKVALKFITAYHQDMHALGCLPPTHEPRVTDNIAPIITFIQGLIENGKAYVVESDVYFSIPMFPDYGKLSGQKIEDLQAGARVEVNTKKRNVLDFALWKGEQEGTFWQSPWGWGRPGWHIECSALAATYLAEHIDIHAGGQDLIFPHHENEIAQSEGLYGCPFARYWMHNGFVNINQEKMSKSLGNFFTLKQVFEQFDPMIVRYYILSHHYKAPMEFSFDDLAQLVKSYKRLCKVFSAQEQSTCDYTMMMNSPIIAKMLKFLCDDLNTPGMFGVLFDNLEYLNHDAQERMLVKAFIQEILGLNLQPLPEKEVIMTRHMEELVHEREQARAAKDWARADALREKLLQLGFEVQDKKR